MCGQTLGCRHVAYKDYRHRRCFGEDGLRIGCRYAKELKAENLTMSWPKPDRKISFR
jgi:hypothetical protein